MLIQFRFCGFFETFLHCVLTCSVDEKEDFIDIQSKHKNNQTVIERLNLSEDEVSVDITSVRRAFDALMNIPDLPFIAALTNALTFRPHFCQFTLTSQR
jgi:hypothetical protein